MTSSSDDDAETTALAEDQRKLLEEIASWDEEKYPIAKHARRVLQNLKEKSE